VMVRVPARETCVRPASDPLRFAMISGLRCS